MFNNNLETNQPLSYSQITRNEQPVISNNTNRDDTQELINLIRLMKKIKLEINGCSSKLDKVEIICKYIDEF